MVFRLALLGFLRNSRRTTLTLILVTAGTAGLIINTGLVTFIFDGLRDEAIYGRFGHLQLYRPGYMANHKASPDRYLISREEYEAISARLSGLRDVEGLAAEMDIPVFLVNGNRSAAGVAHCISPSESKLFSGTRLIAGEDHLEEHTTFADARIGRGLAEKLGARVGDMVTLTTAGTGQAYGGLDVRVSGIFEEGFRDYDDWLIQLPLGAAWRLRGKAEVERIIVFLHGPARVDTRRAEIVGALRQAGLPVEGTTWQELADFYRQVVAMFGKELLLIRWIIQIVAALGIAIAIVMAVGERQREIATLLALGMSRFQLACLFLQESFWLGLCGALLGGIAGTVAGYLLSMVGVPMPAPPGSTRPFVARVELAPWNLFLSGFLMLSVTVAAGLSAVLWIRRLQIAVALRPDEG